MIKNYRDIAAALLVGSGCTHTEVYAMTPAYAADLLEDVIKAKNNGW